VAILAGADADLAGALAESLRRTVRRLGIAHTFTGARNVQVAISVGAACGPIRSEADFRQRLDAAGRALYAAKNDGRTTAGASALRMRNSGGGLRARVGSRSSARSTAQTQRRSVKRIRRSSRSTVEGLSPTAGDVRCDKQGPR